MPELDCVTIPNGQFVENCYLLGDREHGEAVIVDPGEEAERFLAELEQRRWRLQAIWLTHAHIDHILGVGTVHDATGAPVYLHPADQPLYQNLPAQAAQFGLHAAMPPPPDRWLQHGETVSIGESAFTVRHTPGHAPGHVIFVGDGVVLGGDVLFQGSIGRSDLPGADGAVLLASIRREMLSLPDDTVVLPGHGPQTTIGQERRTNPFLIYDQ